MLPHTLPLQTESYLKVYLCSPASELLTSAYPVNFPLIPSKLVLLKESEIYRFKSSNRLGESQSILQFFNSAFHKYIHIYSEVV